jgi:hypothetical protein
MEEEEDEEEEEEEEGEAATLGLKCCQPRSTADVRAAE